jgi:hypothetical protein
MAVVQAPQAGAAQPVTARSRIIQMLLLAIPFGPPLTAQFSAANPVATFQRGGPDSA